MTSHGSETVATINIYARETIVGALHFNKKGQCQMLYTEDWKINGFPLSPSLPLNSGFDSNTITNFLKNLFPEGQAFDLLLDQNRISQTNIHAILSAIGHDTSGALIFSNNLPNKDLKELRKISEAELVERLDSQNTRDIVYWDGKYRLSVAGVQDKLNVLQDDKGSMFLADGQYASTQILKFASKEYPLITINEYYCMKLAQTIGLPVANVDLITMGKHNILNVHRFDRAWVNKSVKKAHLVDGCQALNMPPSFKYEQNLGSTRDVKHIRDGVNFIQLFEFTDQCQNPGLTKQTILDWAIFNILIGNSDAHGKNISFFVGKNRYKLSPFYDLVSVIYEAKNNKQLEIGLAMAIGDNFDINNIKSYDYLCFAEEVAIPLKQLKNRLLWMCQNTLKSLPKMDEFCDSKDKEMSVVFQELNSLIGERALELLAELNHLDTVRKNAF